jgi:hypothetical protein
MDDEKVLIRYHIAACTMDQFWTLALLSAATEPLTEDFIAYAQSQDGRIKPETFVHWKRINALTCEDGVYTIHQELGRCLLYEFDLDSNLNMLDTCMRYRKRQGLWALSFENFWAPPTVETAKSQLVQCPESLRAGILRTLDPWRFRLHSRYFEALDVEEDHGLV